MSKIWSALIVSVLVICALADRTALTVLVPANEHICFYNQAHIVGSQMSVSFIVLSGGSFDIDATIARPDGTIIQNAVKSSDEEFVFKVQQPGEYELCFFNEMSTFADKKVDFIFDVEHAVLRAELPTAVGEHNTDQIEAYIQQMEVRTNDLTRKLQHYKARNSRNEDTVKSTASRVWWFGVLNMVIIVGMAVLNVTIVQFFFKGSRKNLV